MNIFATYGGISFVILRLRYDIVGLMATLYSMVVKAPKLECLAIFRRHPTLTASAAEAPLYYLFLAINPSLIEALNTRDALSPWPDEACA